MGTVYFSSVSYHQFVKNDLISQEDQVYEP